MRNTSEPKDQLFQPSRSVLKQRNGQLRILSRQKSKQKY